jgi:hypothetical protein
MRALVLLVAVLISLPVIARADDNVAAGQTVIRSREQAFSHDDAATAYSFAAPGIQSQYPAPDIFMAMVRNGYTPVYRHRRFEFGEAKIVNGQIVQAVEIVDADGGAWEAIYTLEPQPDGSLKISSCVLMRAVTS